MSLLFSPIGPPFQDNESSIHTEPIQDGRGGDGVKDLSPIRRDEIGGHKGGGHLGSFGDDLKEGIGLFFGREDIAQFIETKDRDFGIEIDQTVEVFGSGEFGGQIKERKEDGLIAFEDGIMADRSSDVTFADPSGANED